MRRIKQIWANVGNLGVLDHYDSGQAKRIRMTNYISSLGVLVICPHLFKYLSLELVEATIIQAATLVFLALVPFLNRFRLHIFARYLLFFASGLSTFLTSTAMGIASGENLAFIALVLFAFVLFDVRTQRIHLIVIEGMLIGSFLLGSVGWSGVGLGQIELTELEQQQAYIGNMLTTFGFAILIAYYFQTLSNRQVDDIIFRAKRQLQSVFDHSYDAIFLVEQENSLIRECNLRALEMFHCEKRADLIGVECQLLHGQALTPQRIRDMYARLTTSKNLTEELLFQGKGGSEFWGNIAYTILEDNGLEQLLIRITDITAQKESEKEILAAKERAESANKAKTFFLANMSHELRTPINGVIGLGEIIQGEFEDETLKTYADLLLESGQRLLRTVSSVLDLSRLESGGDDINIQSVDLAAQIQEVSLPFQKEAREKGIEFELCGLEEEYISMVDRALFDKVMEHLMGNAVKFTEAGKVEVCILRRNLLGRQPEIAIEVRDTGIGMSEDFIGEKLFMKFEQESEGLDRNYEGSGLGLSITKRIIELLQGSIEVESQRNVGTTFRVCFPDSLAKSRLLSTNSTSYPSIF